jgi:NADH:ubiquinone oxidoreductase subunit 2 (subunit N)
MFFSEPPADAKAVSVSWPLSLTVALTALGTLFFGVYPTPIVDVIQAAIRSLAGF